MAERLAANRRSRQGLVIEGEIVGRATPAPARPTGDAALAGLHLASRIDERPYQSLLDDAIRLARRCRVLRTGTLGTASSS